MDKLVDVPSSWMRNGWIIAGIAVDFQRGSVRDSSGHYWGLLCVDGMI